MHWRQYLSVQHYQKSEQLRIVFFVILAGLFCAPFFLSWASVFFLCGVFAFVFSLLWRQFWVLMLGFFFLSSWWGQWRIYAPAAEETLTSFIQQEIKLTGRVVSFPDIRENSIRVYVRADNSATGMSQSSRGKFLLIAPKDSGLHYGQEIVLAGALERPRSFGDFDYPAYLARYDVYTLMRNPEKLEIIGSNEGWALMRWAEFTREWLATNLRTVIAEPHSQIALGILVGIKEELPDFIQTDFKQSGLQHLLVVSGFNVSVLVVLITVLLRRFGRRIVLLGVLGMLLFFVCLTGADPPVLRAAVMGGCVALAAVLGRFSDARNLVLFAAVILGLFDPKMLQSDIGFHLSFAATMGIILLAPVLLQFLRRVPRVLRELLAVSLAAQLFVSPLILYHFGAFPVVGILANLLAEPLIPLAMFCAFVVSITGFLPLGIAKLLGFPAYVLIDILLRIAQVFGRIPPLEVPPFLTGLLLCVVVGLIAWGNFSRSFAYRFLQKSDDELRISPTLAAE